MSREKALFRRLTMDFRHQAEEIGIIMGRWGIGRWGDREIGYEEMGDKTEDKPHKEWEKKLDLPDR